MCMSCFRDQSHQQFFSLQQSLGFEDFFHQNSPIPKPQFQMERAKLCVKKRLYVEMTGQHHCSWTDVWVLREVVRLVIPELAKVGSGLSLLSCGHRGGCSVPIGFFWCSDSKISWGSDNLYKILIQCLAQWSSNLSWHYRQKPNLNNSLDYEFIAVCESVLSRDGFTFLVTCLFSQSCKGSKGSSRWSLNSDHRISAAPSLIPCKTT